MVELLKAFTTVICGPIAILIAAIILLYPFLFVLGWLLNAFGGWGFVIFWLGLVTITGGWKDKP